jgi:hypothetical protein
VLKKTCSRRVKALFSLAKKLSNPKDKINRVIYSKNAKLPSFVNGSGPPLCVSPISCRDKYPIKDLTAIFQGQEPQRRGNEQRDPRRRLKEEKPKSRIKQRMWLPAIT